MFDETDNIKYIFDQLSLLASDHPDVIDIYEAVLPVRALIIAVSTGSKPSDGYLLVQSICSKPKRLAMVICWR